MLRIAVLGAGRIGRIHAGNAAASPEARLVGVADVDRSAAEQVAAAHGARADAADSLIAANDVDAILICTPTDTHADLIERATAAGKSVFCEKPVDLSSDRIRACLRKVDASGKTLMIGFNRRFDPNFAEAKRRIDAGVVGNVELVTILSRDPSRRRSPMSSARAASSGT